MVWHVLHFCGNPRQTFATFTQLRKHWLIQLYWQRALAPFMRRLFVQSLKSLIWNGQLQGWPVPQHPLQIWARAARRARTSARTLWSSHPPLLLVLWSARWARFTPPGAFTPDTAGAPSLIRDWPGEAARPHSADWWLPTWDTACPLTSP